jgi:uncharacterized membrane protein YjfL (UPF0719 family)
MERSEQVRRKGPILIGSICAALIFLAVFAFLYARTTPYYSLYMLKKL